MLLDILVSDGLLEEAKAAAEGAHNFDEVIKNLNKRHRNNF